MVQGAEWSKQIFHPGPDLASAVVHDAVRVVEVAARRVPAVERAGDVQGVNLVTVFLDEGEGGNSSSGRIPGAVVCDAGG